MKSKKYYVVCEEYTDYTQFEGSWDLTVKTFDSFETANSLVSSLMKKDSYEGRRLFGPLAKVNE